MNADYAAAAVIPAVSATGQRNYDPGRPYGPPKWIILHGTAGFQTAPEVAQFFQTGPHSTHYVVGRDGMVVQCVPETDTAWGNAPTEPGHDPWWPENPNWLTLSIEHVKPSADNSDALTAAQAQASFALVRHLCDRWHIPPRRADATGGITGHYSIDPVSRARCPGPYPWDDLFASLTQGDPMPLPSDWHDDGQNTLTAPNGIQFHDGFRAYLLAHPDFIAFAGDPLKAPYATNAVGLDPSHGPGAEAIFNNGALGYIAGTQWVGPLWIGAMYEHVVATPPALPAAPTDAKVQALVSALETALTAYKGA